MGFLVATDVGVVQTPLVSGTWSVDKVLATISTGPPVENSPSPLPFFHMLERLKTTKREGWRRFGISRGESIADHMYRMAAMTLVCPPSLSARLDLDRCIKLCIVHDMAEALVGDITPVDGVAKPEKSRREAATMDYLTGPLLAGFAGGPEAGANLRAIWQEYEDGRTPESVFVHDLDKMELLCQMIEYERRGDGTLDLGEFANVATRCQTDEVKAWAAQLLRDREEFWAGRQHVLGQHGVRGGVSEKVSKWQDEYYSKLEGGPGKQ